jgi:DNA replication protein DnaC
MPCPLCDDTGWKPVETVDGRRVVRCDCWRESLTDRLMADARIPKRYQHCTLDNFLVYPNEKLERAVVQTRKFAEAFPVVEKGLFLVGPPGIGKTHLAVAALAQVISKGMRGLFYDTRELLRVIRSTYDPVARRAEMDVLEPVMKADLLVLDDLGAEKTSEWVEETLNLVVNTRYSEKRHTIFTSNFEETPDPTEPDSLLVRVGFRMHSRLYEMCEFLEFDGADYRHGPANAGPDDLVTMWKEQRRATKLPPRGGAPVRAQLRQRGDRGPDLNWAGGKAGT